jgi:SAM-dependent methyltransferase
MNAFFRGVVRALTETFDLLDPVLEIGSYQPRGQEALADLRPLFPGKRYLGLDARAGPGVDEIGDVEALPYADASVGTVLAMSAFEHVPRFWRGFDEVHRVLRPDGALIVACPFFLHIHDYPHDYWRFTPKAFELLLENYPAKIVGWHGPAKRPLGVWAIAFREARPPIAQAQFDRYCQRLGLYARQPLALGRRLRYRLGRLLCGRRPFAPYLDQERWESECLNRAS